MKQPPPLPPKDSPPAPKTGLADDPNMRMLMPVGRTGWSIAAGYLGLFSLIVIPAPIAIIVSLVAIADIVRAKKRGVVKHGLGRAIFGLIMGIAVIAIVVIFFFSLEN